MPAFCFAVMSAGFLLGHGAAGCAVAFLLMLLHVILAEWL